MDAPRPIPLLRAWLLCTTALLGFAAPALAQAPGARPTGGQVVAGQASITQNAAKTTITQGSDRAAIDWRGFDVGRQHHVQFQQPGSGSWTLNRVNAPDPSMIAGRISANGGVAIVNQSGVVFAQGAQVNVGSLIASAAGITTQNFMAGRMVFDGAPRPGASVENHGTITVADRGLVALAGPRVANSGVIRARLGKVALAGAETFNLDLAGDGLLAIEVTQAVRQAPGGATALVTNSGTIDASGGSVLLTAHAASGLVEDLVRNTGRVVANTDAGRTGTIAVRAEGGNAVLGGTLRATGGAGQRGGNVAATATGTVRVAAGAVVDASGRAGGGDVALRGRNARVEGRVAVRGTGPGAKGGTIAVQATERVTVAAGATVDASGAGGGGTVLLGTSGVGRNQTMAAETIVEAGAVVRADATIAGDGGLIVINSLTATEMRGLLAARGGRRGGNGGFVEISGKRALSIAEFATHVLLGAPKGNAGTLLIDPVNITVRTADASGAGEANDSLSGGAFTTDGIGGNPTTVIIDPTAVTGFVGTVVLNANQDIAIQDAINKANGGLTLVAGDNVTIDAAVTLSGALTVNANSIDVNAAVSAGGTGVALTAEGALTTGAAVTATAGNVALQGGTVTLNAAVTANAGAIDLRATSGNLSQGAGGVLTAASLRAQATGTVALATAANVVTTLAGRSGGAFSFANTSALAVGTVLGTAGVIASDAAANVTLTAGGALTIGQAVTAGAGGTATLTGTSIAANAAVTAAGGTIDLLATTGGIAQDSAGVLTAASLRAQANGDVALATATNAVSSIGGSAGGTFALLSDIANLAVGNIAANGITLTNSRAPVTGVSAGAINVTGAVAGGAGGVTLVADRMTFAGSVTGSQVTLRTNTAARSIRLGGADPGVDTLFVPVAFVNGFVGSGVVRLDGRNALTVAAAVNMANADAGLTLTGTTVAVNAAIAVTGSLTVTGDTLTTQAGATLTAGAGTANVVSLRADTITLGDTVTAAAGRVELGPRTAGNAFSVTLPAATALIAPAIDFGRTANGDRGAGISVSANALGTVISTAAVTPPAITTPANATLSVFGGSIAVNNPLTASGGTIDLLATAGGIAQDAAGVLTAASLRARAATATTGTVALATAANAIGTVAGRSGGAFAFKNSATLAVGTVLGTTGIEATDASASVDVTVTGAGNDLTLDQSVIAPGALTLAATDALSLSGSGVWALSLAGPVSITAGGTVTNDGVIYAAGTNTSSLVQADGAGGIVNRGTIVLGNPNTGTQATAGIVTATAGAIDNQAAGRILAGRLAASGALTNAGQAGVRTASAGGLVTNASTGTLVALDTLAFGALANSGTLATNASITLTGALDNAAGATLVANALSVTGALTNAGEIRINTTASATGSITNDNLLIATTLNAGGTLSNTGTLNVVAATAGTGVTNSGTLTATTLTATTGNVANTATGRIEEGTVTTANVGVTVATLLDAATARSRAEAGTPYSVTITATGGATVPATAGNDIAGGLDLTVLASTGSIANAGRILATRNLSITATLGDIVNGLGLGGGGGDVTGAWLLAGTGTLTAFAGGAIQNAGAIYAAADAASSLVQAGGAGGIVNRGTIVLGDPDAGTATTAGIVTATAGAIDNQGDGRIVAGTVGRTGFALTNAGQIGTREAIGSAVTNSGTLVALDSVAFTSLANTGFLATNDHIAIAADLNNGATATLVANSLAVTGALTNAGEIRINTTASATGSITNDNLLIATTLNAGGTLTNAGTLNVMAATAGTGVTNSGTLTATTLTATTGNVVNTATGRIEEGTVTTANVGFDLTARLGAATARGQAVAGTTYTPTITATGGATVPATAGNDIAGGLDLTVLASTGSISNAGRILATRSLSTAATLGDIVNGLGLGGGGGDVTGAWLLAGSGTLTVSAGGAIQNAGAIYAAADAASSLVQAGGAGGIVNRGTIVLGDPDTGTATTAGIVTATAGAIDNQATGRIVAGRLAAFGSLTNAGSAAVRTVSAGGLLTNTGTLLATSVGNPGTDGSITVTAGGLTNAAGASLFADTLDVDGSLDNSGTIRINGTAGATGNVGNGGLLIATTLNAAGTLTNTGTLHAVSATGGTGVTNSGTLTATMLTAASGDLVNSGRIEEGMITAGDVTFNVTPKPDAATARTDAIAGTAYTPTITPTGFATVPATAGDDIAGGLDLAVAATIGNLTNTGRIMAGGALTVTAGANLTNDANAWLLAGTGALTAMAGGSLTNAGTIHAAGANLSSVVQAAAITNSGTILLGDPSATDATPSSAGTIEAMAGAIDNQAAGRIVAGRLIAVGPLTNAGEAAVRSVATGGPLTNSGLLLAINTGMPSADGAVTVSAGGLTNAAGARLFAGALTVTGVLTNAGDLRVNAGATATGAIANGGLLIATTVASGGLLANTGTLHATSATGAIGVTNGGTLTATALTAASGNLENTATGRIEEGTVAAAPVAATFATLLDAATARAQAIAGAGFTVMATPSGGAGVPATVGNDIAGGLDLAVLAPGGTISNAGRIMATGALSVLAGGNLRNGAGLLNGAAETAGAWLLAGSGALTVTAGGDIQNVGTIQATGTGSLLQANGAGGIVNRGAIALGDPNGANASVVEATGGAIDNLAAGRIAAARVGRATNALVNAGQIGTRVAAASSLTNLGSLVALDGLTIGATLANSGTLLTAALTGPGALGANTGTVRATSVALGGDVVVSPGGLLVAPGVISIGGSILVGGTLQATSVTAGADVRTTGTGAAIEATTVTAATGVVQNVAGARIAQGTATAIAPALAVIGVPGAAEARAAAIAGAAPAVLLGAAGGSVATPGLDLTVAATAGGLSNAGLLAAAGALTATAGQSLVLLDGAALDAETARLAGAAASIGNVTATIGRSLLVQAPGGIAATGRLTVRARAGVLPAIAFDTRAAPPADTLALLQPDTPGLQPAQQPVQVREPGAEVPGTFGPSVGTPAGPLTLDLDAGQSPVFLLIDGGAATGPIIAGRLGIHGTGGSAALRGELGGLGGAQAATRAEITRPIDPDALSRYRFNDCAVSAVNCTVFTSNLIAPPRPPERLSLTVDNSRLDTSEVTVPNVSDTDLP